MPRTELSSFVGRRAQVRQLKELVRARRLLTLVGVGGVGKTRLATRAAAEAAAFFPAGSWFVDLAALDQASLVPHAVAAAVGAREEPTASDVQILAECFRSGRCLLLLDNCEHLVGPAAELATTLLDKCPSLTILATSREPLRCEGEHVFQVFPLALPATADTPSLAEVARSEAGQLFLERAAAAAGFRPDEHSAADLAAVCQRLDGIPLALELGAGLLRTLSVRQLASRSANAVQVLRGGKRQAPHRQQTLEATIDWSYRLLTEPERRVFERLAVFAGGFSLEAAEAVCPSHEITAELVLPILAGLVDKSLVVAEAAIETERRFRLLETVRQFAHARLVRRRDGAVFERHANFFLALAEETVPLTSQPQILHDRLFADYHNLRLALRYFEPGDAEHLLRMAAALWQFWYRAGLYHEGAEWLERALSAGAKGMARERAAAICGLVELRWPAGHFEGIEELSNESLHLAIEAGDAWLEAFSLYHLALPAVRAGDTARAAALAEQSIALARTTGDPWLTAYMLNALGVCLMRDGALMRARDLFQEALSLARAAGDNQIGAYQLSCLGVVARSENDLDHAEALWSECLGIAARFGNWRLVAVQLLKMAELAFERHRQSQAARLLGAGEALLERLSVAYEFPLPELDPLRSAASHGALASSREHGRAAPIDKIVAEILEQAGTRTTYTAARTQGPLTARESEVAALVADGWSNRAIAERLVITERTAENHVSHILDKLAVGSRTQLASRLFKTSSHLPPSPTGGWPSLRPVTRPGQQA